MNTTEWIALAGVVIALGSLLAMVWTSKYANKTTKEFAQRDYEAENTSKVVIDVRMIAAFSNGAIMEEGENYSLDPPPWDEAPRMLILMVVKNEGRNSVAIQRVGIRIEPEGRFISFRGEDLSPNHTFPKLPYELAPGRSLRVFVEPEEVTHMLGVIYAVPEDHFTVDVIDAVDRIYSSRPITASIHLTELEPFTAVSRHHSPVSISEISEEEYFPDGFIPGGASPRSGRD